MRTTRRFTTFAALGVLAAFLLPGVTAHWTTPQVAHLTDTHAHFIGGGASTDVGYFGQRLCINAAGDLIWSGPDGTCPAGTTAFLPPARGLGLGTGDCEDLTIDPARYSVLTPHAAGYPDNVFLDDGDVNNAYISGSVMPPLKPGKPGALGTFGNHGSGLQPASALVQAPAANRLIWYDDADGAPGAQATLSEIFGNDRYDDTTTYFPAPGAPYATPRANRVGAGPTNFDITDHDPETGAGIACFTYAIDNGPNGIGCDGDNGLCYPGTGLAAGPTGPEALDDTPFPHADGCQEDVIAGVPVDPALDGGCGGAGRPGGPPGLSPFGVFCGAGYDLNDPPHPAGIASITLTPEIGVTGGGRINGWPIGNDGVYDTTLASTVGAIEGPAPVGSFVGCPGAPAVDWPLLGVGIDGPKAFGPLLTGTGAGILAGQTSKGVKLHQLGYPAADSVDDPTHPPGPNLLKIGYSLCHDVAATGCTNIPIEDSQSTPPGVPCAPGGPPSPPPGPANLASGCYGHVGSRLQDCVYDPEIQAASARTNPDLGVPGVLGPLGAGDSQPSLAGGANPAGPRFFGEAALWGTKIPKGQPCWPERLFWNPTTNTWTPASEPGSYNGGVWSGDDAPATADPVESITAFISTADLGVARGFTICTVGATFWFTFPTGPGPFCPPAVSFPAPDPASWTAGWASVFL